MKNLTSRAMTLLGLLVMGVTAAYGSTQPKMNGKLIVDTLAPEDVRYTGKPYIKELGAYAFNYRNYDPQTARWTTPDPSGFPDGANNRAYSPIPTRDVDPTGLYNTAQAAIDYAAVSLVQAGWLAAGYTFAVRLSNHSLEFLGDRQAPQDEIDAMKGAQAFTDVFKTSFFDARSATGPYDVNNASTLIPFTSDLGVSYGHVAFGVSGSFVWTAGKWSTTATFTFSDKYDFDPNSGNPAITAFNRLQTNGYATIFNSSGTFTLSFAE